MKSIAWVARNSLTKSGFLKERNPREKWSKPVLNLYIIQVFKSIIPELQIGNEKKYWESIKKEMGKIKYW